MKLLTEPVTKQYRRGPDTRTAPQWLDELSTGACDEDSFLRGVGGVLEREPDTGWELLALLDQYYRRGKIRAEVFGRLKTYLQGQLMAEGQSTDVLPSQTREQRSAFARAMPRATPASGAMADSTPTPTDVPPPAAAVTSAMPRATPASGAMADSTPSMGVPPPAPAVTTAMSRATPTSGATDSTPTMDASRAALGVTTAMPRATPASGAVADSSTAIAPPPAAVVAPIASAAPRLAIAPRRTGAPLGDLTRAAMSNAVATPTPAPMDREAAETLQPGTERLLASGDVLRGRYRVQGLLGQGGMGTVFEAIDEYRLDLSNGDQRVALKVLHTAVIQRPRLFAELRREFQHLQSLSHPNIVRVHEFDRDGDMAFFTMEYLSGALLSRLLFAHQSASLHRPFALAIVRDVGAAVAYAHARGVVHGDLNPENIFITDNGEVRVLDFSASHQLRRGPWISEFENPQQITVATPTYASCQLLEGETADVRDDIYALACLAYALLTGNHPFGQYSALRARTLRLTPDRPSGLSGRQWNALRAGLHFARDRRPPDMQAWLERLDFRAATVRLPALPTLLTMRPRRPTGMLRWALNGALVALIVACAWWAATHADSLANAAGAVGAKVKSTFANTVGHMGDTRHENGGDIPPADVPARSAPAVEGTRSAALAAHDAPSPHGPLPPPVNALAETHGASRAPANITPPITVSTAPAAASAAATSGAPGPTGSSVHARIELASDTVEVAPTQPVAYVVVHRSRSLRGDVAFNWWTESGTAKPGRDFVPVKYRVEHIEDGKNSANLVISIVSDPARHDSRSFYVVIDEASDNAALGARTLTMVTIPGSE